QTTYRSRVEEVGLEPDECYFIDTIKRSPDLALEVVKTSGGIDRLEIYRRLRVREVWFWIESVLEIYCLVGETYQKRAKSSVLPDLDLKELIRRVDRTEPGKQ